MRSRISILTVLFSGWAGALAQFAPPAGQPGTTAMHKDSSAFVNWASACTVARGLEDITNPSGAYASVGDSSLVPGIADNGVVSLGDGGSALCTFAYPLRNGPGADFAVFENSFSDDYLELAFVEVSSDGLNFFRFPATSYTQDTVQTGAFDLTDATKINNLAGKYRALYGTPFDLQELQGQPGLDVNNITHVKIIDVIGSINPSYATYDKDGRKVNDPWTTPFPSSGFDLDAVGVIHDITNSVHEWAQGRLMLYPNPASANQEVVCVLKDPPAGNSIIEIINSAGEIVTHAVASSRAVRLPSLPPGVYTLRLCLSASCVNQRLVIIE